MENLLRNIQRLVIPLTFKCNLNCAYCYVCKDKREDFTEETLKKTYELLLKNNANPDRAVYFFGGEPLLRYDLLQWSVAELRNLAQQYQKKVFLAVTTNGLLLDEEKIKFLTENLDLVGVSIDNLDSGYAYRNVKSIKAKLPLLLKYQGQDKILIKMTIMPEFADSFFNSYELLIRLGFRHINIAPALGYYWSEMQIERFLYNLEKILKKKKFLGKFGYGLHLKMVEDIKYIVKYGKEHCPVLREELAIDTNGDVYPCQFFVALPKEYRENYVLGNINQPGVNSELVKKVEDFKICDNDLLGTQIARCQDCQPDRSCKKICYAFNLPENRFDSGILANAWRLENDFIDLVKKYYLDEEK